MMMLDDCHRTRDGARQYAVVKRSVIVGGHKTSVSLEDAFWDSLRDIAARDGVSLSSQLAAIDLHRKTGNLSSAIRLFVLDYFRSRAVSMMMIGDTPAGISAALSEVTETRRSAAEPS
ncbi:MAG TPA: ribbon-helix-helix domain-containing protein [Xanthobacteraceae bacterium]|nr:ribbon-helix-helix domain-containing protein [Xanthobacteraceae bacterium]